MLMKRTSNTHRMEEGLIQAKMSKEREVKRYKTKPEQTKGPRGTLAP